MEEHFVEGITPPHSTQSSTTTDSPPGQGAMSMPTTSGMPPPVGLVSNVGNNYPNPQQISLEFQNHIWTTTGLQTSENNFQASNEEHEASDLNTNGDNSNNGSDDSNNGEAYNPEMVDDDTSLSDDAQEEKGEEENNHVDISPEIQTDEEDNDALPLNSTEMLLPKALEDVLALKDQRAAEYVGSIVEGHADFDGIIHTTMTMEDDGDGDGDVSAMKSPFDEEGITDVPEAKEEEVDNGGVQNFANEAKKSLDIINGNVNGEGEQVPKTLQQSKSERNKRKKRRKKLNKQLKKQQQQERQQQQQPGVGQEEDIGEQQKKKNDTAANQDSKISAGEEKDIVLNGDEKSPEAAVERRTSAGSVSESNKHSASGGEKSKTSSNETVAKGDDGVVIEYVPEKITIADLAPMYRQFYRVFEIFKMENKPKGIEHEKELAGNAADEGKSTKKNQDKTEIEKGEDEMDNGSESNKEEKEKLSKRKLKKLTRLSVAELKQLVSRPDVVEMHDVTARDPKLLVQLKAYRNTVQVPRHWCFKRKYLQGKRGIEKPPFDLPTFIKRTGIMEMRESLQERDEAKSMKMKMRERVRPKMGKIDIDYQKLHDAFFKWQTKPRMTIHGDLYYEGKEFETRLKEKKPGDLSEELRIALGMPVGITSHKIPPPWLIAQQRYGPPPSYPSLKIPGLNAPIPDGCAFGYHAGGWGKPPVDESGKPLYGDVFGTNIIDIDNGNDEADIERNQWGELESESEESSEEEEEDGEDMTNQADESGLVTPAEGLVTPSGLNSVPAGMETPDSIELRKKKIEQEMEDNETPVLYHVLPEKRTDRVGASMMASTHVYDIGTAKQQAVTVARATTNVSEREGIVELALDPSELDMDNEAMAQRYEQQMREQQSNLQKEDLSDMLAEHVARQKSKRKRQTDPAKTVKKYKEFKF